MIGHVGLAFALIPPQSIVSALHLSLILTFVDCCEVASVPNPIKLYRALSVCCAAVALGKQRLVIQITMAITKRPRSVPSPLPAIGTLCYYSGISLDGRFSEAKPSSASIWQNARNSGVGRASCNARPAPHVPGELVIPRLKSRSDSFLTGILSGSSHDIGDGQEPRTGFPVRVESKESTLPNKMVVAVSLVR
jgi:hypothetical protein